MSSTRAFLTGVAGQDGSYLAEQLLADGVEVHALVRAEDGPGPHCPERVIQHPGDLVDLAGTRDLLLEIAPDEVYNLAGLSSVAQSWAAPDLTAAINGAGAAALLESAHQLQELSGRPVRFVQAASAEIFGNPADSPQREDTPIRPVSPYGASKAYAHLITGVYRQRGLHACSLILYNHESPRRPESFVTRKISAGVAAIATGRAAELALGNLDAVRDWGWAPDYVAAMLLAARHHEPDDYVIATGVGHTVRDFVAAAFARAQITDWERYLRVDERFLRPADPVALIGDPGRARERLGWQPGIGFEELVGRMVDHDLGLSR